MRDAGRRIEFADGSSRFSEDHRRRRGRRGRGPCRRGGRPAARRPVRGAADRRHTLRVSPATHGSDTWYAMTHRGAEVVMVTHGEQPAAPVIHPLREHLEFGVAGWQRPRLCNVSVGSGVVVRVETKTPYFVILIDDRLTPFLLIEAKVGIVRVTRRAVVAAREIHCEMSTTDMRLA